MSETRSAEKGALERLADEWEHEAARLTWPEEAQLVARTLLSCASEVRRIISPREGNADA